MPVTGLPEFDVQPRLMIVDDEEMVLTSISALLKIETNYHVGCYTDPQKALEQAGRNGLDLVVADYLMPGLDGIELLTRMKALQPEATRILLTGYADKESAIKAINQVGLFQYIEKPWDNRELLLILRNGLERRFLFKQLQKKILELDEKHTDLKDLQKRLRQAFI